MKTPHIPHNEKEGRALSDPETLPDIMTVKELAKLLRMNVKTVYEAITNGEIPGCKRIGRNIRISRRTVLDWLNG